MDPICLDWSTYLNAIHRDGGQEIRTIDGLHREIEKSILFCRWISATRLRGRGGSYCEVTQETKAKLPAEVALVDFVESMTEVNSPKRARGLSAARHVLTFDSAKNKTTKEAICREISRHLWIHLTIHGFFAPEELKSALGPDRSKGEMAGLVSRFIVWTGHGMD